MWFRVDDGLNAHRKVRSVRRSHPTRVRDIAPMGLWVVGGSWCSAHSPEGFIPLEVLEDWDDNAQELAQRLVDAGMWHDGEQGGEPGYYFHDWADFRPESAKSSDDGKRGNHIRWHEQRGVSDPDCELCPSGDDRPDSPPISPPESPPESLTRPDPSRPDPTQHPRARLARRDTNEPTFEDFWKAYPRKTGKGAASKAWVKAAKKASTDDILAALREQLPSIAMQRRTDGDFRPHPATWLNQERWEDEAADLPAAAGDDATGPPPGSAWGLTYKEPTDDE